MKINIKIIKNFTPNDRIILSELGLKVKVGWDSLELEESDPRVKIIKEYFNSDWKNIVQREIVFSEKDKENAEYLTIYASKILGDTKPDTESKINTFTYSFTVYPYYKDVFEIADTDEEYGLLRGKQIGNYSLNGDSKWGNSNIAPANYIEDAFFTPLETYESIFKLIGIKLIPVYNYKTGEPLKNICQIIQQGISKSKLNIKETDLKLSIKVDKWNIKKYVLKNDIFYPSFIDSPGEFDFFYTQEYFGDGGLNQRNTVISHKRYKILK